MNYYEKPIATADCMPAEERKKTVCESIQDTKSVLKELLLMMGDTNNVLFGYNPFNEPEKEPEKSCMDADVELVSRQARAALSIFNDIRRQLV